MDVCGDETKPCPMKGGPDFRPADYTSFTITGPPGQGLNIIRDRFGDYYWGFVAAPPGPGWRIGASLTEGYLNGYTPFLHGRKPTREEVQNFILGQGYQVCVGVILGGCETWSPGSGTATEYGFFTPQFGGNGGYTYPVRGTLIAE